MIALGAIEVSVVLQRSPDFRGCERRSSGECFA